MVRMASESQLPPEKGNDPVNRLSQAPRRTEGKRVHGRSARVQSAVLDAAAEELGRVGFAALRIDDVAQRSGVNKTTIYRRWPTKLELVAAVIAHETWPLEDVDHGGLESDIRAVLRELRERLYTVRERGVMQVLMGERAHPEVAQLVRATRERHLGVRMRVFERAQARGEISASCKPRELVELITSPLVSRIMHLGLDADDAYIEMLTTVLSNGIKSL
jgi:AcrR family transcriptional regulator